MSDRRPGGRSCSSFVTHPSHFRKAVFLDRDGTVIANTEYSADREKLRALPGAVDGLRQLQGAGYLLIIVTNQSGVARGLFDETALRGFHDYMLAWFRERGVRLDALYYCPHYAEGKVQEYAVNCDCRKPQPGMFLRAAREHGVDLKKSWMVGDSPTDVAAGINAGCRTIRIGRRVDPSEPGANFEASDLVEAADAILKEGNP